MSEDGALVITGITAQKRRPDRVSVYINNEFAIGAEAVAILGLDWRVGKELTPEELNHAQEELENRAARASAEVYLGHRPRTAKEVTQKLEEKGYSPGAVRNALQHLARQGYINDEAYASQYVEVAAGHSMGRQRIKAELRRRGVDAELADMAASTVDDDVELKSALEFATRRAATMVGVDPAARTRRLWGALQRRGFSPGTVRSVLDHLAKTGMRSAHASYSGIRIGNIRQDCQEDCTEDWPE